MTTNFKTIKTPRLKNIRKNLYRNFLIISIFSLLLFWATYIYASNFYKYDKILKTEKLIKSLDHRIMEKENLNLPEDQKLLISNFLDINDIIKWWENIDKNISEKWKNYLSNIYLLSWDYQSALDNLNWNEWTFYFNLGNIELFKWYNYIKSEKEEDIIQSYESLNSSLNNYERAQEYITGTENINILNYMNLNIITWYKLKYMSMVKLCIYYFKNIVTSLTDLQDKIDELNDIFLSELRELKQLLPTKDKSIDNCLKNFIDIIMLSKDWLSSVKQFIENSKSPSLQKISNSIDEKYNCYEKRATDIAWINDAITKINKSISWHYQTHSYILWLLTQKEFGSIIELCQNPQNMWQQQDQFNKELNDWLEQLNKLLNEQESNENNQDKQNELFRDEPVHTDILDEQEKQLMEEIENLNKNWIEEMEKTKSSRWYHPENYLKQLFKQFIWNDKDFKEAENWKDWWRNR